MLNYVCTREADAIVDGKTCGRPSEEKQKSHTSLVQNVNNRTHRVRTKPPSPFTLPAVRLSHYPSIEIRLTSTGSLSLYPWHTVGIGQGQVFFKGALGALVVYDISRPQTFDSAVKVSAQAHASDRLVGSRTAQRLAALAQSLIFPVPPIRQDSRLRPGRQERRTSQRHQPRRFS